MWRTSLAIREPVQRRYATITDAIADMGLPSEATRSYVAYDPVWGDMHLEQMHSKITSENGADTILVLPERATPYMVDMTGGFKITGDVASVTGWASVTVGRSTWFTATRGAGGIVGLGPGAKLAMSDPAGWSAPAQDAGFGWTDQGATFHDLSDATCSVVQFDRPNVVIANLHIEPRQWMGGVAFNYFNVLRGTSNHAVIRRISSQGGWYGFKAAPNGEVALLSVSSSYDIRDCWIDARLPDGTDSGVSPVMVNSSSGGRLERVTAVSPWKGMTTWWHCSGTHNICQLRTVHPDSHGINLEQSQAGVVFNLADCRFEYPGSGMHIAIGGYGSDALVNVTGGEALGASDVLRVQVYGASGLPDAQRQDSITRKDKTGADRPLTIYGGI